MIPTTISELAKRHKWLTEELTRALALSGRDIDTMCAVDLVLDVLKKAWKAEKKITELEAQLREAVK